MMFQTPNFIELKLELKDKKENKEEKDCEKQLNQPYNVSHNLAHHENLQWIIDNWTKCKKYANHHKAGMVMFIL